MDSAVGNLEQVFLVFQTLQNQTCLRFEGYNFQHYVLTLNPLMWRIW